MWLHQQPQSLHVARDSPVTPLACSPSCSPPAARHRSVSAPRHHRTTHRRSSRPAATCGQGAQIPRCLAAHEPRGGDLRVPGHRRCISKDTGNRACRPARPGRPGAASTRWRTQDCPDYRRCRIGTFAQRGHSALPTGPRVGARELPWDDGEPAERPGWMLHTEPEPRARHRTLRGLGEASPSRGGSCAVITVMMSGVTPLRRENSGS